MPDLDTQIPAWLQRNWAPTPAFDVTPWLQERYRRQVEQQKLPLQLQQMALQNEVTKAGIEHQGMMNELAGMQLQQYQEELPRLKELATQYSSDPVGLLNHTETFSNPLLQKQWADLQKSAAMTQAGLAMIERTKQNWITYRELVSKGAPPPKVNPDGTIDEQSLAESAQAYQSYLDRTAEQRYGYHDPVRLARRIADLRTELDTTNEAINNFPGVGVLSQAPEEVKGLSQDKRSLQYELNALESIQNKQHVGAAEYDDQLLQSLQTELEQAKSTGNPTTVAAVEARLRAFQNRHRDPEKEARIRNLQSAISTVFREMVQYRPENARYGQLKAQHDALNAQLEQLLSSNSESGASAAQPQVPIASPITPAAKSFQFVPGKGLVPK